MGTGPFILVVDDDSVVLEAVCALLESLGHEYRAAASCAEARELLANHTFVCGIIDLSLPDGNGLSLLPTIRQTSPCCTPIVLSADFRPETIVETMQAGVFDYMKKPVDYATFQATIARALHHSELSQERDRLNAALSRERERLQARVEETTAELRDHARRIELVNARQEVLLNLNKMTDESYNEETFFRRLFEQLSNFMPLECVALITVQSHEYFIASLPSSNGKTAVVSAEPPASSPGRSSPVAPDRLEEEIRGAVELHARRDTQSWAVLIYPQRAMGRVFCAVGFFVPSHYEVDRACGAFLEACATTITSKWQELRLFYYAAKQASVGNLALDLSRNMVQNLTAIRTAGDVVLETDLHPDAIEGMRIVVENAEELRCRLGELRQLSLPHKNIVETVHLDSFAEQALATLSSTLRTRGIVVDKEFTADGKCVLFNGGILSRTVLDLMSSTVRSVQNNQRILLRLQNDGTNTVLFEIHFEELHADSSGETRRVADLSAPALGNNPKFILAQRTIRGCGGTLSVKHAANGWWAFSLALPRNVLGADPELEEIGLS